MFTNDGFDTVLNWLGGNSPNYPQYLGIGSDSTAVALTDTALGSAYESGRFTQSSASSGTGYLEMEYIISSNEPTEQPCNIKEWGVFDSTSSGSMYLRNTFIGFNKSSNYEVQAIVRINISGG